MGASLDIGRLADSVVTVWLLLLGGFDAVSVAVLFRRLMLQLRMGIHPCLKVVGFERPKLILFEVDEIVTVCDTAFGDMSAKLAAKHTVQFTGGQVGVVLQHGIDKFIHAVQSFFLGLELEQFFQFQHLTTFEDGLVLMVDDGIAVGFILGTVENEINAKPLLHQGVQLFFVGAHITVLQENGSKLLSSLFIRFEGLAMLLDGGQWQGFNDVTITFDAEQ